MTDPRDLCHRLEALGRHIAQMDSGSDDAALILTAADEIDRLRAAMAEANDAAEANAAWGGRMKQERDALSHAWLRVIQAENTCDVTGRPCDAKRCGCHAEQEMLIREADDD